MSLKAGQKVIIKGTQSPGGRIEVDYASSGLREVAADAGDYVYPADVRLDTQNDLLYVKASGLAGGINRETWLFKYDLLKRRQVTKQLVSDDALPADCPANPISK